MIPFPDIAPEIFTLHFMGYSFSLRWYALAYLVGLIVGWRIMVSLMKRPNLWGGKSPMAPGQVEELLTWVVLGVIVGGRLGFVLFYDLDFYLSNPVEILKLTKGGMSFHGGFLGVVVVAAIFCRRHKIPALRLADALGVAAPIGLGLGRIANFINAELWGHPTSQPWGVIFPGEAAQTCPGVIGPCARHPSQLYEAGLEGIILAIILFVIVRRRGLRRPGLALGTFLAGYGISRFVVEFFRQADARFITAENPLGHVLGGPVWGVSMGQLLSLPMIAVGAWFILRAIQRPAFAP